MDSGAGFVVLLAFLGGIVLLVVLAVVGVCIAFGVRREDRRRREAEAAWRSALDSDQRIIGRADGT